MLNFKSNLGAYGHNLSYERDTRGCKFAPGCKLAPGANLHPGANCAYGHGLSEAVLTCIHNLCFEQNKKNITILHLKIIIFFNHENRSLLHGHVCVMLC